MTRQIRVSAALALAGLGLLAGGNAMAEVEGFYFGIGGGLAMMDLPSKSTFDNFVNTTFGGPFSSKLDDNSNAWDVQVGYRFNRWVAAEFGYVNFGKQEYVADFPTAERYSVRYLSTGLTASVLGLWPINERFDVHGRAGIYQSDTRVREARISGTFASSEAKASDRDLFVGVGGAWNINESFTLRLEYTHFMKVGDKDQFNEFDINLIKASILFR